MTVDGYRDSGEIQGAVAKTADEVFTSLPEEGARLLRDILVRLVESSPDGAVVSRRVARPLIAIDDAHAKVVDRLVDARLLTIDEESVQVSHEALAREWPRLKEWLADDVEGQRIMRHLGSAASAWDGMGRPDSELYRGGRLATAQHWRDEVDPALTPIERAFLDAAAASEIAELAATQSQLRNERRMVRRLSWVSAGAAGLAIAAVAASLVAGFQANLAGERATVAEARRVAALALDETYLDRALLLAVEAIHLWDSPETRVNLVRVLSRAPRVTSIIRLREEGVSPLGLSLTKDGTRASVIDSDDDVRLFDLGSRSQLGEYSPPSGAVLASAVDPRSGSITFSEGIGTCSGLGCERFRIGTLDLGGGGRSGVTTFQGLSGVASDVEYSPDGSLFAALTPTDQFMSSVDVALWRPGAGDPTDPVIVHLDALDSDSSELFGLSREALKFSPDGSLLYVSAFGPTVALETESGRELSRISGSGILAVSPDGRRVAVRGDRPTVRIGDAYGRAAPISVALSSVPAVADFSPDSRRLAIAAGNDIVVVSATTGNIVETLREHAGTVTAVEFRPSGELVTAGADGAILTWDLGDWWARAGLETFVRQTVGMELDERTVALEQPGGMTRIIVASPAMWEERACRVAGRALTEPEWEELLGALPYAPACRSARPPQ